MNNGVEVGTPAEGPAPAAATLGVEEEFLLVDAATGRPAPRAQAVLAAVGDPAGETFKAELLATTVEAVTGVCTDLDELARQLAANRRRLAAAARGVGAQLVSAGTPVLAAGPPRITPGEHYARMVDRYADVVADYLGCGCHVHVGVPDRETGVRVLNRLRPWLPTLLALSANSPFNRGRDTGYASWRTVECRRFPAYGVPPRFASAADHDEELDRLVGVGALEGPAASLWTARLSLRYPTVEIRVADAAGTVREAVLQAALCRALVRTAIAADAAGRAVPAVRDRVLDAALWSAARHGLEGPAVHPVREERVPAAELAAELLAEVSGALAESGDLPLVRDLLADLYRTGTGARRQRTAAARGGPRAAVDLLVGQTVPAAWAYAPAEAVPDLRRAPSGDHPFDPCPL